MPLPMKIEAQWSEKVDAMDYARVRKVAEQLEGGAIHVWARSHYYGAWWWGHHAKLIFLDGGHDTASGAERSALAALATQAERLHGDRIWLGDLGDMPTMPPREDEGPRGNDIAMRCNRCGYEWFDAPHWHGDSPCPECKSCATREATSPDAPDEEAEELDDCQRCTHDQEPPCGRRYNRCNYLPV